MQRPRQIQQGSGPWQGEGAPGPGVLREPAPSSLPCLRLARSIERKSRTMLGPTCMVPAGPFSTRKRSAALRCRACCHKGLAASPSGLGWPCSLRLALPQAREEPEPVAAYPLPLAIHPSTLSRQFLRWAGICTLASGAAQASVLPGCLFQPPSSGGPMGICTSMVSGGVCAGGSRP